MIEYPAPLTYIRLASWNFWHYNPQAILEVSPDQAPCTGKGKLGEIDLMVNGEIFAKEKELLTGIFSICFLCFLSSIFHYV